MSRDMYTVVTADGSRGRVRGISRGRVKIEAGTNVVAGKVKISKSGVSD